VYQFYPLFEKPKMQTIVMTRVVSAGLHTPTGGTTLSQGPEIQCRRHGVTFVILASPNKTSTHQIEIRPTRNQGSFCQFV